MSDDRRAGALRNWHMVLLRFAISLDDADRFAVLTAAAPLDAAGADRSDHWSFQFFHRTSMEVCDAIANENDPGRRAVLRVHLERIEDIRLRRALEGALGGPISNRAGGRSPKQSRQHLWIGLPAAGDKP